MATFADLIYIYRKSDRKSEWTHSNPAVFCVNTADELRLLIALDEECEKTGLIIISDNPKVGDTLHLQITSPKPTFGRVYENFNAFVSGDMAQIFDKAIGHSDYYIMAENISSTDNPTPSLLADYHAVKTLINHLIEMGSYINKPNKQLIFFSQNIFELSIDMTNKAAEFGDFIRNITPKHQNVIGAFSAWLKQDQDITKSHHDEKKSILAFVLTEEFSHQAHLLDVLEKITEVYKSIEAQYALYIANFSYKKFLEKLNETNEKFVARINDTVSKTLPQFLGLPFLTAIPTALKSEDNWLVYTALLFYCAMCFLGLSTQKAVLNYIKEDVKNYTDAELPKELANQWQTHKNRINTLVGKQELLYCVLVIAVALCFFYGLYKLAAIFGV